MGADHLHTHPLIPDRILSRVAGVVRARTIAIQRVALTCIFLVVPPGIEPSVKVAADLSERPESARESTRADARKRERC